MDMKHSMQLKATIGEGMGTRGHRDTRTWGHFSSFAIDAMTNAAVVAADAEEDCVNRICAAYDGYFRFSSDRRVGARQPGANFNVA